MVPWIVLVKRALPATVILQLITVNVAGITLRTLSIHTSAVIALRSVVWKER